MTGAVNAGSGGARCEPPVLQQGDWAGAHMIAGADDSRLGSWLHGIVHLAKLDEANGRCWHGEADRTYPGPDELQAEIAALQLAFVLRV
jgi:hypothetical protein